MTKVTRARRQVRLSRALGLALTPKAVKHFEKRPYPPGEHGRARRRTESDYAVRLREKQRLRAQYGLREKQMARAFEEARKTPGLTGEALVENLESRLDALVLRAGFARTILQARQVVVHRHILVDGKIVDRPSSQVKTGQTLQVKPQQPDDGAVPGGRRRRAPRRAARRPGLPGRPAGEAPAVLTRRPKRAEVPVTCEVQLVVEYYSR